MEGVMSKKKAYKPSYFNQGKRLDIQMETSKFAELLSAESLLELKNIMDKRGRKNEKVSKNYD